MYFFIEISRDLLEKEALESKECRLNSRVVFPLQIQLPLTKSLHPTTAHPQCDGHLTCINACGVWGARVEIQVFKREFHTYIHLDLVRV